MKYHQNMMLYKRCTEMQNLGETGPVIGSHDRSNNFHNWRSGIYRESADFRFVSRERRFSFHLASVLFTREDYVQMSEFRLNLEQSILIGFSFDSSVGLGT